ncbi:MAG: peptidase C11, partial [Pseudobutyrivibrio sp.]|nr:peptidase C11 [Pseudobutyrivibrio sp.]
MADRPVSRKKNITGSGSVNRRGSGLSGGTSGNRAGGFGGGSGSSGGGLGKLLIIALIVLLGGGGGLGAFLGGGSDGGTGSISSNTTTSTINMIGSMASLLLGSGYTSTAESGNASWSSKANTGILDDTVASTAREKYTMLLGDGKDTVTILVYA